MRFNKHFNLEGRHSFLSPSKHAWLNYSNDRLVEVFRANLMKERGTRLHALASEHIKLGIKMPKTKNTLCMFVNDAIGFKMESEQPLYYSDNCFGTADAISFKDRKLRIHDLKTGVAPTHMEQLMVYAALFCLEYSYKPGEIEMELRIYQNDEITVCNPTAEDIAPIMDKIIAFDKVLTKINEEEGLD